MVPTKPFTHSKVLWFNFITLLLVVLSSTEFAQVFPEALKYIALLNLLGNSVLRIFFPENLLGSGHND